MYTFPQLPFVSNKCLVCPASQFCLSWTRDSSSGYQQLAIQCSSGKCLKGLTDNNKSSDPTITQTQLDLPNMNYQSNCRKWFCPCVWDRFKMILCIYCIHATLFYTVYKHKCFGEHHLRTSRILKNRTKNDAFSRPCVCSGNCKKNEYDFDDWLEIVHWQYFNEPAC